MAPANGPLHLTLVQSLTSSSDNLVIQNKVTFIAIYLYLSLNHSKFFCHQNVTSTSRGFLKSQKTFITIRYTSAKYLNKQQERD